MIQEGGDLPIYSPDCGAATVAALLGVDLPAGDFAVAQHDETELLE
jgi:hypothetical protein